MFEGHHAEYFTPEKRSFQVLIVDQAKLEQSMVVPDAELRAAYNASMDTFSDAGSGEGAAHPDQDGRQIRCGEEGGAGEG